MTQEPLFGGRRPAKRAHSPPLPDQAVQRVLVEWIRLFEARFHERPLIRGQDGAAVKRLIAHAGVDAVAGRLPLYLALDDPYVERKGYPLSLLPQVWNELVVQCHQQQGRTSSEVDRTKKYLQGLKGDVHGQNG